jgi:predicted small lipoprotein YifL
MSKPANAVMLLLIALLLPGCGRKGPLYIQQEPVKPTPVVNTPTEQKSTNPNLPIQSQPVPTQTQPIQTEPQK